MIADWLTTILALRWVLATFAVMFASALAVAWCCWRAPLMEDDQ